MVLNLSSPFFNFLSCVLMSTIEIVTSGKKNLLVNLEVIHLKSYQMSIHSSMSSVIDGGLWYLK